MLAEHAGKVLERDEIYRRVWGYAMIHGDRSVDVFVRKLRSKLQKRSPGWDYIHTHFGIGYRFDPQPLDARRGTLPDPSWPPARPQGRRAPRRSSRGPNPRFPGSRALPDRLPPPAPSLHRSLRLRRNLQARVSQVFHKSATRR